MAWNSWLGVVNCGYLGNSYSFQHSVKSALFDRLCTPVRCPTTEFFLCGRSSKTFLLASLSGEKCSGGQLLSTFSDLAGRLIQNPWVSLPYVGEGMLCTAFFWRYTTPPCWSQGSMPRKYAAHDTYSSTFLVHTRRQTELTKEGRSK